MQMMTSEVAGPRQLWWRLLRVPLVLFVLAAGLFSLSLLDLDEARHFYAKGWWQQNTMYMLLRQWAERQPDHYAIRDTECRLTYREALQWVDAIAADLHNAGLRQGDRVSIWLPSRAESVLVLLACSRMGYVCNPSLHRDYTCGEIRALLERVSSAAFFAQPGYGADADRCDIFDLVAAGLDGA